MRVALRALISRTLSSSTMLWILEDSGQGISEYRKGLLKRNTVLYLICFGFLGIPFKLKRHPLEILSRCSSGTISGPPEKAFMELQLKWKAALLGYKVTPIAAT